MDELLVRSDATVLRRGRGDYQVGTDPRWAVRLEGLSPAQEEWLSAVVPGRPPPPAEGDQCQVLVQALSDALLLVPRPDTPPRAVRAAADGAADLRVLSAMRPDALGRRTLEARARRCVAISGLGRLGAMLAVTLATAGVGQLVVDDPRAVVPADIGAGGYALTDVGTERMSALRRVIAAMTPTVSVTLDGTPDMVVLIQERVADPGRTLGLMGAGVPHLSVVLHEADVVVGPFVLPGRTPCLRCLDLAHQDQDPAWPLLARQLRAIVEPVGHETILAVTGAAVAAGQVLMALDGARPRTAGACIEIPAPDAMPRQRESSPHPHCGCSG